MEDIVILGGGISGLAIAEAVMHQSGGSVSPLVLESETHPGGKIRSFKREGFVVETGPHGFLDKEPCMGALIERLGLTNRLIEANKHSEERFVVRKGQLRRIPKSPPAFLLSDILSLWGRLRVLLEFFSRSRANSDESVRDFAVRHFGREAADVVVDAVVTGIYAGDPSRLSLKSAFPQLSQLELEFGSLLKGQVVRAKEKKEPVTQPRLLNFRGGLVTLIEALSRKVRVETERSVRSIERVDEGFVVRASGGEVCAKKVVLALPTFESAKLVGPFAPSTADALRRIDYAPASVVVHAFHRAASNSKPRGFGFLVPHREKSDILGTIWASEVFPEHAPVGGEMFRTIVGGVRNREIASLSTDALGVRVRSTLGSLGQLAEERTPDLEEVLVWKRGIPQYEIGHEQIVAEADDLATRVPGLHLAGNGLRGVAMVSCVRFAQTLASSLLDGGSRG